MDTDTRSYTQLDQTAFRAVEETTGIVDCVLLRVQLYGIDNSKTRTRTFRGHRLED